ncbi:hypothetical protein A6R68_02991, partial [Neotoma lepida]
MTDRNKDGFINREGSHDLLPCWRKRPGDEHLDAMISEASGPISFSQCLLNDTDCEVQEGVNELWRKAPIDKKGNFNHIEFTHILKDRCKDN